MAIFDAHLHIIDPRFPLVANQGYLPAPFSTAGRHQGELMYCQTLQRVEDVRASPDRLLAVIVPEQGNFSAGRTQWLLEPRGTQVLVRYQAELVPDFTLPPVIGTTLVRQALARELRTVLERLERLAESSRPPSRG